MKCIPCFLALVFFQYLVQLCEGGSRTVNVCKHSELRNEPHFEFFLRMIRKHHWKYVTKMECVHRYRIFLENLQYIHDLNHRGQRSAVYGITKYSDLTAKEFRQLLAQPYPKKHNYTDDIVEDLPEHFDWREKGAVNEVLNMGPYKYSRQFMMVANLEGVHAAKFGRLMKLSEQQIVECLDTSIPYFIMKYMVENGSMSSSDYPYVGPRGECKHTVPQVAVQPDSYVIIPSNEGIMQQYVYGTGPVAAGLNAKYLQHYTHGIIDEDDCGEHANFGVNLVGFGIEKSKGNELPYWIARNVFGKDWGEDGYFRISRGKNTCVIGTFPYTLSYQENDI